MTPDRSLDECLQLVRRVFDADEIAARRIDSASVAEYYRQSDRGYRLFHSAEGALHLALNDGGAFEFDGYAGQAAIVQQHLQEIGARSVLEAGCGNGFNLVRLARKNPRCQFLGVDLTTAHVAATRQAAADLDNLRADVQNYEHLPHGDQTFDLAFAIESLCQTDRLPQAIAELHRVTRAGGRLVVVDCFRNRPLDHFDDNLQLAARLVEKTTAVDAFSVVADFVDLAESARFRALEVANLNPAVQHNLDRLYGLARRFFNMGVGRWAMKKTFGPRMLENAICGLLMPHTVGAGVHGYHALAFQRV